MLPLAFVTTALALLILIPPARPWDNTQPHRLILPQDVAVNVVGKYSYHMTSPADSTWVPLIIDIILVGRTKIITLHSGIWLENAIDRRAAAQGDRSGEGRWMVGWVVGRQVDAHRQEGIV